MAALVQTLPPQTFTMHSGRPSSSGGYLPSQNHAHQQSRNRYSQQFGTGYRGIQSTGPIAPYAFTSTPQLHTSSNPKPSLIPTSTRGSANQNQTISSEPRYEPISSAAPSLDSNVHLEFSKSPLLDLSLTSPPSLAGKDTSATTKASPDRYRRTVNRTNSSEMGPITLQPAVDSGNNGQLYSQPSQSSSSPALATYPSYRGSTYIPPSQQAKGSTDDTSVGRTPTSDLASRYRRRSLANMDMAGSSHSIESPDTASTPSTVFVQSHVHQNAHAAAQQSGTHVHTTSTESASSSRSARSPRPTSSRQESFTNSTPKVTQAGNVTKYDGRPASSIPRASETTRRNPSPLSRPANINPNQAAAKSQLPPPQPVSRPVGTSAAEHLAAVSQKNDKKSKSKLRRAFSFGSAAELRKATTQSNFEKSAVEQIPNKRNSKYQDELEPEQARIAEKQEAGGLGESIYSGQGQFFTGSTDNLSISSTASSASIMLRKMGKGVKKGTRSLVGLFRPKSVIGVPAADGPVNGASAAQVSMVTVEAEREKVNVNIDPHDHPGGGTGFPKLERNSMDNKMSMESTTVSSDTRSRRSIVGGDLERAEVLAAVRKGILKRTDSNQPSPRVRTTDLNLPHIPNVNDSPRSSAPSTPADEPPRSGHRRTDSIAIEGNEHDDYFASMTRFASVDSKSAPPLTPQTMRGISFSPRIQFHDTWPSGEYDRRGDIATCNRLTPMLAQQIKEELNTFKMEMEVHESSKVYTHFF